MKHILFFSIIVFFLFLLYLAYYITKEEYVNFNDYDNQYLGIQGIKELCISNTPQYNDPAVCFDISYINPVNKNIVRTKAEIQPGYFIDVSGFIQIVPYGYVASTDKKSYISNTNISAYNQAVYSTTNTAIDISINEIQQKIDITPKEDKEKIRKYEEEITELKQKKISNTDINKTANKMYNSDNIDIVYHEDPTKETPSDTNSLPVGRMWIKDNEGNLKSVPYNEVKNKTLYYPSGSYVFNPPAYVPNYQDSILLSKASNPIKATRLNTKHDFCENTKSSTVDREIKCNTLDHTSCINSNCCVLLGGEKCVAGDYSGPSISSNYSDITIINRDYYYYKGGCYGNCP